jgi:hypothetical protein
MSYNSSGKSISEALKLKIKGSKLDSNFPRINVRSEYTETAIHEKSS